jgi:hypothetical protein
VRVRVSILSSKILAAASASNSRVHSCSALDGGDIDKLTQEERDSLFFSSTNDANEGAFGSWRGDTKKRPAQTLHKFNASFTSSKNKTEDFISGKLTEETDHLYLKSVARARDASGAQKVMKAKQIKADKQKVAVNARKEIGRQDRKDGKAAAIMETSKKLVLEDAEIDKLLVKELDRQLDFHRAEEKKLPVPMAVNGVTADFVPLKTHMKTRPARILQLKKAVLRFHSRNQSDQHEPTEEGGSEQVFEQSQISKEEIYESDYHDDEA